jgi:hypothetical protein
MISKVNDSLKDLLRIDFVLFFITALISLHIFKGDSATGLATAFLVVLVYKVVTKEAFELIYPGPDSSPNCLKITKNDLVAAFDGENNLKKEMLDAGVPYNLHLTDLNAPQIATYLINNPKIKNIVDCKLT